MPGLVYHSLAEYNDMAQTVIDAMLTLPDDLWLVLFHRFYNRLPYPEIDRVLELEQDQARKLEARALRAMRRPEVIKTFRPHIY